MRDVCFFKQKTAYGMRISDWSSDVCSSDLPAIAGVTKHARQPPRTTAVFTPFARIAPPLQSCRFCLPPEGASMSTAALDASKTPHRATAAFGWLGATLLAERGRWPLWLPVRSEEHTSELQSLMRISYAVFCLKKKKTKYAP